MNNKIPFNNNLILKKKKKHFGRMVILTKPKKIIHMSNFAYIVQINV